MAPFPLLDTSNPLMIDRPLHWRRYGQDYLSPECEFRGIQIVLRSC